MNTRPELRGTFGMVASTHWLGSAAGMAVLEQGGNAFDAAVATGFTLQVVEPHLNGPGGDLPALLWPADRDRPLVLCAQGPAPRAATISHYRDELGLALVPGTGPLAAVVPGAFGGWLAMLREHGTLPLRDVLRFAIGYAEEGYPAVVGIGQTIRRMEQVFRDDWTTSAEVYLPAPTPGTLHRNPRLAATYRRLAGAADPLEEWYRGFVAEEASPELRPGAPGGREPRLPKTVAGAAVAPGVGEPTRGDTVHLDVVDRWGNMVTATPSGGWLNGAPTIPSLGFCLGTRAQMFWLEEDLPNSLAPGKRPRTTLSPTMAARGGEPYLATGTPGGDQQDQWTLHVFLGHVHFGLNLQAAIDAPNHHTEAFPSSFYPRETLPRHVAVEERVGEETIAGLRERGHEIEVSRAWSLGRVSSVAREPDGILKAGANPRGEQGYASGR